MRKYLLTNKIMRKLDRGFYCKKRDCEQVYVFAYIYDLRNQMVLFFIISQKVALYFWTQKHYNIKNYRNVEFQYSIHLASLCPYVLSLSGSTFSLVSLSLRKTTHTASTYHRIRCRTSIMKWHNVIILLLLVLLFYCYCLLLLLKILKTDVNH